MPLFGGSKDGGALDMERARQSRINEGVKQLDSDFGGFNEDFYNKAKNRYVSYNEPQLMQQYGNTRNNLTYALARSGLLHSGSANTRNQSLQNELAVQQDRVGNQAQDFSNQIRGRVAEQKGNLVGQLQQSADPSAIQSESAAATSALRAPSVIQPIGNLFDNWSQVYLAGKANSSYNGSQPNIWSQLEQGQYGQSGNGGGGNSSYMVG